MKRKGGGRTQVSDRTLHFKLTDNPEPSHWTNQLDKPCSISATLTISSDIAAKEKPKEDPSIHPDYPRNVLPEEYWDFSDTFSKDAADCLPSHRPGNLDHKIPLEPETTAPFMHMYNM